MAGLVKDKATAFINELGGQVNNKILCKASSHDIAGPKKKHVDFLIQVTNDSLSSITELTDLIFERSRHTSWVVVMKLLITSHSLMTLGNERFLQCLATRSATFSLEEFMDYTDSLALSMSVYVPRYARYLAYMCAGYRTLAMDVCRLPREEDEAIRMMDSAKLIKMAGVIQQQIDHLLEVDIAPVELTNGVICTVFLMLYKDVLNLYSAYNQVMINLLERFFDMKKQQCKEVIDAYRKFVTRQEGVAKFLAEAEKINVDRNPPPEIKKAPEDLLPALETHLNDLDTVKKSGGGDASPSIAAATERLKVLNATDELSSASSSGGQSASVSISSHLMEAQRKRFEELKSRAASNASGGPGTPKPSNQSTSSPAKASDDKQPQPQSQAAGLNDLLGLQVASTQRAPPPSTNPWGDSSVPPSTFNPFESSGMGGSGAASTDPWSSSQTNSGVADPFLNIRGPDFDSVFGKSQISAGNPPSAAAASRLGGGGLLQPTSVSPLATYQLTSATKQERSSSSDANSSLSGMLDNLDLDIKSGANKKGDHQWKPAGPNVMTGGPKWQESQQPSGASKGTQQPVLAYQQQSPFMSLQQPGMAQPAMMQSVGYTQPGLVQQGFSQPGYAPHGLMQPGFTQPGLMQTGFMQPVFMQPGMVQAGFTQPGMMQAGFTQPGMMQAGFTQPGMMQPSRPVATGTPLWPQTSNNAQHNNNSLL